MTDRRIDLERARREAKALLRAARAGDAEARARLRLDREARLADAQHAIARDLCERSWPALVRQADGVDELLDVCFAGNHEAALALARDRPRAAERVRSTSPSPLIRAAREGNAGAVYALLEVGVPANARDPERGGTALHVAVRHGCVDVVDLLVGWVPLDRFARDDTGATALGACAHGSADADDDRHLVTAKVLVSVGLRVEPGMAAAASRRLAAWLTEQPEAPVPGDRFGEEACAADVALLTHLSRSPLAEVRAVGDGFAMRTGLPDNTRNGVVCSRVRAVAEALAWLRDVPAQWMTASPDVAARLERASCGPERTAVHMAAPLADLVLADAPAPAHIAAIADPAELAEAFDGAGVLDGDPGHRERELALIASLGFDEQAPLRHYVARLDGRAVGMVSVFVASSTLLGVTLEVASAHRLRGIGRALARHALREGRAAGCTLAILGPTPATVPFYAALGFTLERSLPDRSFYLPLAE
jgi:GNAT superfamily N-acetyltransferase